VLRSRYEFGDLVLVPFPYTDQSSAKQRPAVVVSKRAYNEARPDAVAMAITTVIASGDVAVTDWRAAGLLRESAFKPIFATFEQAMVRKRLGSLAAVDLAALKKLIATVLG
jgi:mRNA interferase MazF